MRKPKQKKTNFKQSHHKFSVYAGQIISNLMKKLLKGIGYANAITVEEISPEDVNLKDLKYLKLHIAMF
ncbi:MAG: hypothetical protein CM1200mP30_10400 [Pseudomonadota bacterium]|nr:MAG: hypothetical protein CM1200mP30_10400 [Pseudomonadota bacterium]